MLYPRAISTLWPTSATNRESQPLSAAVSNSSAFAGGSAFRALRIALESGIVGSLQLPERRATNTPGSVCSTTRFAMEAGDVIGQPLLRHLVQNLNPLIGNHRQ